VCENAYIIARARSQQQQNEKRREVFEGAALAASRRHGSKCAIPVNAARRHQEERSSRCLSHSLTQVHRHARMRAQVKELSRRIPFTFFSLVHAT
jgi:hypothetical protein